MKAAPSRSDFARSQDVGCCFGQESRKLIRDGFPEANIVASDIIADYWCALPCPISYHRRQLVRRAAPPLRAARPRARSARAVCVRSPRLGGPRSQVGWQLCPVFPPKNLHVLLVLAAMRRCSGLVSLYKPRELAHRGSPLDVRLET